MENEIYDIIIDTDDRFIGKYKKHRISIILCDDGMFDADIQNANGFYVMEIHAMFEDMKDAREFCLGYINHNT